MNPIKHAFDAVGGRTKAALLLGRSYMAMSKMEKRGLLPRTEYTGETTYAQILASNSDGAFTAQWLLEKAKPDTSVSKEQP
ncbi:hypothetical protein [Acinetobacter gerneri]|uniref:Uncharacterized protein n=1 Tax=Acinetobacter gerneri DSM 14967 = CIP 107464 = MTCC 9824 TaxID=1120926 RepID=N8YCN9_9GAMM|nr:hypothetical protein [Acinetobacter gerneri]ENV34522.1 hypothetical protein F960_01260 [Acinetobacter gerneri DSM 14967 = CIP 107464 = MTCC 9824]EPR82926.1 putative regulator protein [Acinetobacter gerneri DSM 14967 = CIP 107464 = MTCC 9824]